MLCILVHTQRQPEATPEVLLQLNQLTVEEATEAIRELQGPRHFIRGSGSSLTVEMELTTLDDQRQFSLRGLVDSGCTGSSIDSGFVKAKGLNAKPLPRPIPVYNADGTLNGGGMIMHTLTLRMNIGKHSEQITLGVTNLGKSDLFLGHERLHHHNPSIDWQSGSLKFNRCPQQCRQVYLPKNQRKGLKSMMTWRASHQVRLKQEIEFLPSILMSIGWKADITCELI